MLKGVEIQQREIVEVEQIIRPHIRRTPVVELRGDDFDLEDIRLTLKLECLQYAGSFKTRGAFANLLRRSVPASGVVAASGGNHGAAVAYAAMKLGFPAHIFVPRISSPAKVKQIENFGAHLVVGGDSYDDALNAARVFERTSGALPIHAFDQRETLLGQGTLALEFQQQAPELNAVLASVGGGGLIGGIAAWFKNAIAVVGVEPEGSPTMTMALEAGAPVDAPAGGIAADSLAPRRIGDQVFPIVSTYVDRVILVSDEDIRAAQRMLWERLRIVAEPGGVAALSAVLSGKYKVEPGAHIGVVISGANTVAVNFQN